MDACIRPSHTGRQTREPKRSRLAAFLCCAGIMFANPSLAATAPDLLPEKEETATLSPSAQHEVSIRQVLKGQEMAVLSAHLTDASITPVKNVSWRVKNSAGDVVFDSTAATAAIALHPGYYGIELQSGSIKLEDSFTLLEGHSLTINFVLNAGALRVLSRIKGLSTPDFSSDTLVYALSGKAKGRLVTRTSTPGEIISLAAGQYRVESRLKFGNASAIVDVKVQPGVMSAIEINHRAGLARLAYVGTAVAKVEWEIRHGPATEPVTAVERVNGLNASVILRPGKYIAIARIGNERLTASFQIDEGEARDILLGN